MVPRSGAEDRAARQGTIGEGASALQPAAIATKPTQREDAVSEKQF